MILLEFWKKVEYIVLEKKTIYPPMATMVSIPLDIDVFNNSPIGFIKLL